MVGNLARVTAAHSNSSLKTFNLPELECARWCLYSQRRFNNISELSPAGIITVYADP